MKKLTLVKGLAVAAAITLATPGLASATSDNLESSSRAASPQPELVSLKKTTLDDGSILLDTGTAQVKVKETPATKGAASASAARGLPINCYFDVHNVHPSSHVSGTINGTATTKCSLPMSSLAMHYGLVRQSPNTTMWSAPSVYNSSKKEIQNNRAVSCKEGPATFKGWAQTEMYPPAGYYLAAGSTLAEKYGKPLSVACGVAKMAPGDSEVVAERITLTFLPIKE